MTSNEIFVAVLAVVLPACAGSSAVATEPSVQAADASVETSSAPCRLVVRVTSDLHETMASHLGGRTCVGRTRAVLARPSHSGESYFVDLTLTGARDRLVLGHDVFRVTPNEPSSAEALLASLGSPPGEPRREPRAHGTTSPIAANTWITIADGTWNDGERYSVAVRVDDPPTMDVATRSGIDKSDDAQVQ